MTDRQGAWNLEAFLDSLVVELDRARDTLALKAINQPLSYAVRDLALELQLFPEFNGEQVLFQTAKPGETGAAKVSIQLGSITDRQIRETSRAPVSREDLALDEVEEIDEDTRRSLRRLGVTSVEHLKNIERRNVDLKAVAEGKLDYRKLAGVIDRARRGERPPRVDSVRLERGPRGKVLSLEGEHLAFSRSFKPIAKLDDLELEVTEAGERRLQIALDAVDELSGEKELVVVLDPYAICRLILNA